VREGTWIYVRRAQKGSTTRRRSVDSEDDALDNCKSLHDENTKKSNPSRTLTSNLAKPHPSLSEF